MKVRPPKDRRWWRVPDLDLWCLEASLNPHVARRATEERWRRQRAANEPVRCIYDGWAQRNAAAIRLAEETLKRPSLWALLWRWLKGSAFPPINSQPSTIHQQMSTTKTPALSPADINSADYKNLVDLLAVHSEAKLRLAGIELAAQEEFTGIVDEHRTNFAKLQSTVTESVAAIEALAVKHPEWFAEKRSVKTPYGTVKVTRTTKLNLPNEEVTVLLIERAEEKGEVEVGRYLRTKKEPNLEALAEISDAELKAFRIERIRDESVKVTEAKIDFGKAVKAIESQEVAS